MSMPGRGNTSPSRLRSKARYPCAIPSSAPPSGGAAPFCEKRPCWFGQGRGWCFENCLIDNGGNMFSWCDKLNTSTIHNGRTANHDNRWDMFATCSWNILRVANSIFSGAALLLLLSFSTISEVLFCNKDSMAAHYFDFYTDYKIVRRKNSLWGQK